MVDLADLEESDSFPLPVVRSDIFHQAAEHGPAHGGAVLVFLLVHDLHIGRQLIGRWFSSQQTGFRLGGRQGVVQHIAQAAPGKYRADFFAQLPALVAALAGQRLVEKPALEAVKADDPDDLLGDVGAVAYIGAEAGYRDLYDSFTGCIGGEAESFKSGGDLPIFKLNPEVSCNIAVADGQRPCFSRLGITVGDCGGGFCAADLLKKINGPLDRCDSLRRVDLPAETGGGIGHQLQL